MTVGPGESELQDRAVAVDVSGHRGTRPRPDIGDRINAVVPVVDVDSGDECPLNTVLEPWKVTVSAACSWPFAPTVSVTSSLVMVVEARAGPATASMHTEAKRSDQEPRSTRHDCPA